MSRIEALGIDAALCRRELHKGASAATALRHRKSYHQASRAAATFGLGDAHAFDLAAEGAEVGKSGDEAELKAADYVLGACRNHE